jgi:hypothetical protein
MLIEYCRKPDVSVPPGSGVSPAGCDQLLPWFGKSGSGNLLSPTL